MKQVVLLFPGTLEKDQKTKQKQVSKSRYKTEVKKFHNTLATESLISTGLILLILLLLLLLLLLRLLLQGLCSSQSRKLNESEESRKDLPVEHSIHHFSLQSLAVEKGRHLASLHFCVRHNSAAVPKSLTSQFHRSLALSFSVSLARSPVAERKIQSLFIRPKIRVSDSIRLSSQWCSNPDPGCLDHPVTGGFWHPSVKP